MNCWESKPSESLFSQIPPVTPLQMLIFGRQHERLLSENKRLREELDEALNRQGVRQLDDPHISAHDGSTAKRKADTTSVIEVTIQRELMANRPLQL